MLRKPVLNFFVSCDADKVLMGKSQIPAMGLFLSACLMEKLMHKSCTKSSSLKSSQGGVLLWLVLLIGIAVVFALWWWRPQPEVRPMAPSGPPLVNIQLAEPQPYQTHVQTQGVIKPQREVSLTAQVSGQVVATSDKFDEGGFFEADEVLVSLDNRDYQYALVSARAQVASAEMSLAQEKGEARQAKRAWRDLGSKQANALFLREPQLKAAQASLESAKAELARARLNLKRAEISVPFGGRILETRVELGQYVTTGATVAVVYDSSVLEVTLPLSDQQLALLGLNLVGELSLPITLKAQVGGVEQQWQATIIRANGSVDEQTRYYHVRAEVSEPFNLERHSQALLPGMFVYALIPGRHFETALSIPTKAIVNNQVFVVGDNQQLALKAVQVIDSENGYAWVTSDIRQGEQIVISDPRVLKSGMAVEVAP